MRITFLGIGCEQMGVSLLSAIARKYGHETAVAFSPGLFEDRYNLDIPWLARLFDGRRTVMDMIERQRPQVLCCSALTGTYQWMLDIARDTKRRFPRVRTVFGGVHPSAVPDRVIRQREVDYVCVGEGDIAFPLILDHIESGGEQPLANTWFKARDNRIVKGPPGGFIQDLDSLPFFDKTLWEDYINLGDVYFTIASRGCPYRCTYCFNNFFANLTGESSGSYIRHRSPEHVIEELRLAKRRYRIGIIDFEDDVFTIDKAWLKRFLDLYKREIHLPFQCLSHPNCVDEDTFRWLASAGCRYIQMGIQSMDDDYKVKVIRRPEKAHRVERALELMRRYGIKPKVDHMFALPGEPLSAQQKALELYIRQPPYRIQTFWTNFLPGTEMLSDAVARELISPAEVEDLLEGRTPDYYRHSERVDDPAKLKWYKAYETAFKLIPLLPEGLRRRLDVRWFAGLPGWICGALTFSADVIAGLLKRNPDHIAYARYYLHHIAEWVRSKMGLRSRPFAGMRKGVDGAETASGAADAKAGGSGSGSGGAEKTARPARPASG